MDTPASALCTERKLCACDGRMVYKRERVTERERESECQRASESNVEGGNQEAQHMMKRKRKWLFKGSYLVYMPLWSLESFACAGEAPRHASSEEVSAATAGAFA